MHPVPGTITDPAVGPRPSRALSKRAAVRKARSFGSSPRQTRDRINGFKKD